MKEIYIFLWFLGAAESITVPWSPDLCGTKFSAVDVGPHSTIYVLQRGNSSCDPVQVLDNQGRKLGGFGKDVIGFDVSSQTWGGHGIRVSKKNIFVANIIRHTLQAFDLGGKFLFEIGTPGLAGNSTSPLQFDGIADLSIDSTSSFLYVGDGDGGQNNRVVKLALNASTPSIVWATPAIFNSPHSVALHERADILIVADRDNGLLKKLNATTGNYLGVLRCETYGQTLPGKPFGVRLNEDLNAIYIAFMDNPQDSKNQYVALGSAVLKDDHLGCFLSDRVPINVEYSGPHLLGTCAGSTFSCDVDGYVYAALLNSTPQSTIIRLEQPALPPSTHRPPRAVG